MSPPSTSQPPLPRPLGRDEVPDEAYAEALEVEAGALSAREPTPTPEVAEAARLVRLHFAHHRPAPASFPSVALRILDLVGRPDVDLNDLARNVRMDAGLASGLLALSNSAVYRGVKKIETVKDAMTRLGLNEVAKLAAAISTRALHGPEERAEFERYHARWDRLFLHAAAVARGASELYRQRAQKVAGSEQVFMAGLLHDVGKSIALRSLAALAGSGALPALDEAAVGQVLQLVHVAVGAELHAQWQMPAQYAGTAAHHHDAAVPAGEHAGTIHLVRMVSALGLLRTEPGEHPRAPVEAVDSARALGVLPNGLAAAAARIEADEEWVRILFAGPARG
jgi:putative nucleotidyltransferase with HDIG domain